MPHGRGQLQHGALGLRRDGTFVGLWIDVLGDAGAYPIVGALIPNATVVMAPGTYRFERAGGRGRSAVTNTTPMGAYRGAGRPEACALLERLVDIAAGELEIDPVELRRRNLVPADAFPFTERDGPGVRLGELPGVPRRRARGARLRRRCAPSSATRRARGDAPLLGIGLAMWIDCTPMNRPGEYAAVDVVPDDRAAAPACGSSCATAPTTRARGTARRGPSSSPTRSDSPWSAWSSSSATPPGCRPAKAPARPGR